MENDDDILGQLAFVASRPDLFEKEDMVSVMKAAMAVILELRMEVGLASKDRPADVDGDSKP